MSGSESAARLHVCRYERFPGFRNAGFHLPLLPNVGAPHSNISLVRTLPLVGEMPDKEEGGKSPHGTPYPAPTVIPINVRRKASAAGPGSSMR